MGRGISTSAPSIPTWPWSPLATCGERRESVSAIQRHLPCITIIARCSIGRTRRVIIGTPPHWHVAGHSRLRGGQGHLRAEADDAASRREPRGAQRRQAPRHHQPGRHADSRQRELPARGRVHSLRQPWPDRRRAHVQRDEPRAWRCRLQFREETARGLRLGTVVRPAPWRPFNSIVIQDAYNHGSWMDYGGGWTPGMARTSSTFPSGRWTSASRL